MPIDKIRILIVDDTALYRKILKDVLQDFKELEIAGTAPNGRIALEKIKQLRPDMVTMDIEMPEMDGLETLRNIKASGNDAAVIMVSAHTQRDAEVTLKALDLGAFDFIAKPSENNFQKNVENLRSQFKEKLEAFISRRSLKFAKGPADISEIKVKKPAALDVQPGRRSMAATAGKPNIVAIGVSTGGPRALGEIIPKLPENLPVPIVIVQHMPPVFTNALAESLDKKSKLTIKEAANGDQLKPSHVYIAPGGRQMKVKKVNNMLQIEVTDDPPENHCRPAADYLFRSVADSCKNNSLGVILTGMGRDGTKGLGLMKEHGARVLAQNKETCVVFGMPMEAIKAGVVDEIIPLSEIAGKITKNVNRS